MSSVVISKSPLVVVRPSEPVAATGSEIPLSNFDKLFSSLQTVFVVFEHPIHEPAETIRRGLSQALVHYYPIAGRLAAGATSGEVVIRCTGEGVSFVAASANCAMNDVAELCDSSLQEELALYYPSVGFSHSDPLMLMQVTVFSCGGFIVGLTWTHHLSDGSGMAQFFRAVGELARGLPSPSVVPVRSADDSLMLDLPATIANGARIAATLQPTPRASQNITLPCSLIDCIRRRYSMSTNGSCSVFEAVAAVLWRCRTRAIVLESDPDALVVLSFMADARKYASAQRGFYGNCVIPHVVVATSGMVANGEVVELVKMIQRAKVRLPDQSTMDEVQHRLHGYNLLTLSSLRNFGVGGFDFGAGGAARLISYQRERIGLPFCAVCVPGKDEHNIMAKCVREEHADAFLQELRNMGLFFTLLPTPSKL